jgi:glycosyltransferase involved in cell wall biosynthesis
MKIVFVTLGFAPLRLSGLDVIGERLVQGFLRSGHKVTVVSGHRGLEAEVISDQALEIHRLPLGPTDWIGFARRVSGFLQHQPDADVVHFWDVHFAYAFHGAYVASLHHSFRQRLNGLGDDEGSPTRSSVKAVYYHLARRFAEKPALQRARGLMAISRTTREAFLRDYGIGEERIKVTRHGIDTDFFRPVGRQDVLKTQFGMDPQRPVLLFAGFITPRKGLTYLARALPLIRPAPQLVLLGRWRSPALREKVKAILGPDWANVIEPGFVPDHLMPAYYSMADVYVSASLMEGFGLPLAEALACETPVVAAAAGSVAEVVGPGGRLVPPRDPRAMAEAISELLGNSELRKSLARAGAAHIRREFGVEKMVADTLAAYENFLG